MGLRIYFATFLLPLATLLSLTTYAPTGDDIQMQLTRKPWELVDKRSSLGGDRESLTSPGLTLTFKATRSGMCEEMSSGKRYTMLFNWDLQRDPSGEWVVALSPIGVVPRSLNPDNFVFGPNATQPLRFNVRIVSPMRKMPSSGPQNDVQLRFTPNTNRYEKAAIHYFFR